MMSKMNGRAFVALLLAMTSGCTLAYKEEVFEGKLPQQCSQASDCVSLVKADEADKVLCENHICIVAECMVDDDCESRMCDEALHTCIALEDGVEPPGKECKKNADCDAMADELCSPKDGRCYKKWGCLETEPDWTNAENVKTAFNYNVLIRSLIAPEDATVLRNISARACGSSDPNCERPSVPTSAITPTEDGHITVPFNGVGPTGWTGTIRVSADLPPSDEPDAPTVLPGYFQFTPQNPLVSDVFQQARGVLIDTTTADTLAKLAMTGEVAKAANAVFFIYDCGGNPAADMTIAILGTTQGTLFPLASEKDPLPGSTTGDFGAAFLANIPTTGFQTFIITDAKKTKTVTSTLNFNVFDDGINYMHYYPRYSALKKWKDYAAANPGKIP